jgi:hypothetical protein
LAGLRERVAERQIGVVKHWRKRLLILSAALGLQGLLLALALVIGVLDPPAPREARLRIPEGSPTRRLEQQLAAEQQLAELSRSQQTALAQLMDPVLEALRPDTPVARPQLAESVKAMGAMLPMDSLFAGSAGAFSEGMEADSLPPPDPVNFLGESLAARRIVLLLDVSGSVKSKMERAGVSMQQLRAEVHRFVDQLGPDHLFGIIQFTRKWQAFRPELVPATERIRAEARDWIDRSFRTTGTAGSGWNGGQPNGIEAVLRAAFAMDPQVDELFIVSDGDFYRTPAGGGGQHVPWPELRVLTRQLQERAIGTARLRMLCFFPPEAALADLRAWVRENGPGTLRMVDGREP